MNMRIGFGYDTHALVEGRPFRLGGVTLVHDKGPDGHSDADVLVHAICDALLGAGDLRDIGHHFPDTDPRYKDVNSLTLLREVTSLLFKKGYRIGNIDSTILLEAPKVNPHVPAIKEALAGAMDLDQGQVSIKATTNEKLGPVGRGEAVSAYAVALIHRGEGA
jgi:2-C-methyl-D-erythritol 2,4-cyclodiphosphate synthase